MIYVTYQCYNEDVLEGKPITKNFKNQQEQFEWESHQDGHPFLHYKRVNTLEPGINLSSQHGSETSPHHGHKSHE